MKVEPYPPGGKIAVLGAGIIGVTCALELVKAGFQVEIIDRNGPDNSASAGNAGHICLSHIEAQVDLTTIKSIPMLMMRRNSPLIIPRNYLRELAPWLKTAALSLKPSNSEDAMIAMVRLHSFAWEALEEICSAAGCADKLSHNGVLYGYTSAQAWKIAAPKWERKQEFGIKWSLIDRKDLADVEPVLYPSLHTALIASNDGRVSDPQDLLKALTDYAAAVGVTFVAQEIEQVAPVADNKVQVTLQGAEQCTYDGCVLALGAWSHSLAAQLGDQIPLESQRGYNHTFTDAGVRISMPVVIEDQGLAITTMERGLRIGGWIEFGGLERPANPEVFTRLLQNSQEVIPNLNIKEAQPWMGHRPATPDSLPVIGPSAKTSKVIYAFGHGHLGLTQSAATAKCVAALAVGNQLPCPLDAFSAGRF